MSSTNRLSALFMPGNTLPPKNHEAFVTWIESKDPFLPFRKLHFYFWFAAWNNNHNHNKIRYGMLWILNKGKRKLTTSMKRTEPDWCMLKLNRINSRLFSSFVLPTIRNGVCHQVDRNMKMTKLKPSSVVGRSQS